MGVGVFSLRSLCPQGQERNGFPPVSYPMKKSEWEETQGSGAIPRLPAGTSSSVICLIHSPAGWWYPRGASAGKGLARGLLPFWRPSECLVGGVISFSFSRHGCRGLPGSWSLPGAQCVDVAVGQPRGLTKWFFLLASLSLTFHTRANASSS